MNILMLGYNRKDFLHRVFCHGWSEDYREGKPIKLQSGSLLHAIDARAADMVSRIPVRNPTGDQWIWCDLRPVPDAVKAAIRAEPMAPKQLSLNLALAV